MPTDDPHPCLTSLAGKSYLSVDDLSADQLLALLNLSDQMKIVRRSLANPWVFRPPRALALVFEKPSLRTRTTFDIGMQEMGGHTCMLGPTEVGMGSRETAPDVASNLERWVDVIAARVFSHQTLHQLCSGCSIPVINALSDLESPCQTLADLQAWRWRCPDLQSKTLAWVGDGNNILHSLMLGCAKLGIHLKAAIPPGYHPDEAILSRATIIAASSGSTIQVVTDVMEAARGAHAIYTDVWTSMGQEKEMIERVRVFRPYQVNDEVMAVASPNAVFMHCLPAHRGDEVTDSVMDSPQSIVFDQAECRLHTQKALIWALLAPQS